MTEFILDNQDVNNSQINASLQATQNPEMQVEIDLPNWPNWVGALSESPSFDGDPVEIQKKMRDEWS